MVFKGLKVVLVLEWVEGVVVGFEDWLLGEYLGGGLVLFGRGGGVGGRFSGSRLDLYFVFEYT